MHIPVMMQSVLYWCAAVSAFSVDICARLNQQLSYLQVVVLARSKQWRESIDHS
jgi:hypothetical protein